MATTDAATTETEPRQQPHTGPPPGVIRRPTATDAGTAQRRPDHPPAASPTVTRSRSRSRRRSAYRINERRAHHHDPGDAGDHRPGRCSNLWPPPRLRNFQGGVGPVGELPSPVRQNASRLAGQQGPALIARLARYSEFGECHAVPGGHHQACHPLTAIAPPNLRASWVGHPPELMLSGTTSTGSGRLGT